MGCRWWDGCGMYDGMIWDVDGGMYDGMIWDVDGGKGMKGRR